MSLGVQAGIPLQHACNSGMCLPTPWPLLAHPRRCTGSSAACPTDVFLPSTTTCRAAAGVCDEEEK